MHIETVLGVHSYIQLCFLIAHILPGTILGARVRVMNKSSKVIAPLELMF